MWDRAIISIILQILPITEVVDDKVLLNFFVGCDVSPAKTAIDFGADLSQNMDPGIFCTKLAGSALEI